MRGLRQGRLLKEVSTIPSYLHALFDPAAACSSCNIRSVSTSKVSRETKRRGEVAVEESTAVPDALEGSSSWSPPEKTGLYGYKELESASGFLKMARDAREKSQSIIHELRLMPPSVEVVRRLDEISDSVCRVLDAAELCRNTHPDREFVRASEEAYFQLSQYVQSLNSCRELYSILRATMDQMRSIKEEKGRAQEPCHSGSSSEVSNSRQQPGTGLRQGTLPPGGRENGMGMQEQSGDGEVEGEEDEAWRVARMLRMDFERGGVHLEEGNRAQVEKLGHDITVLGSRFMSNINEDRSFVDIRSARAFRSVPQNISGLLQPSSGAVRVPANPAAVAGVLKWVDDAEVRKAVHLMYHTSVPENVSVLDDLIAARHELAQTLGFPSYAHLFTSPLLAGSPSTVSSFLHDLSSQVRSKADEELSLAASLTRQSTTSSSSLPPWDRSFLMGRAKAQEHNLDARVIASYFPLDACLHGLCLLVDQLFGLRMEKEEMRRGESWAEGVTKFTLSCPDEGPLGTLYLDLHPRQGKYSHAAHFTLQCGRRVSETEWQLPVVALVCNFGTPEGSPKKRPQQHHQLLRTVSQVQAAQPRLSHAEVETLFHEFGHALHSLLSRTEFQHLSGTRAALDFVEVPSHVFEYFAWDYNFLRQWTRHVTTGEPIPASLVRSLNRSKSMFAACDLQTQVVYSLLDQTLFGPQQPLAAGSSSAALAAIFREHSNVAHVPGTHWESRFSHLVGYGAGYYSYLYAKAFASQIWSRTLECKVDRSGGELLQKEMLRHGGAKDPKRILRKLLGGEGVIHDEEGARPPVQQMLAEAGI